MKNLTRLVLPALFLLILVQWGCAKPILYKVSLPEQVLVAPERTYSANTRIAIFSFEEPAYAPGVGRIAARYLLEALQQNELFSDVSLEEVPGDFNTVAAIATARQKQYDLIILGAVLYYIDGGNFQATSVSEQVMVLEVKTAEPVTIWRAMATETAQPVLKRDYLVFTKPGRKAPPAQALLWQNTLKFCKMLIDPAGYVADESGE